MRTALALVLALAACHNPPAMDESSRSPLSASDHSGPHPTITGTVVDARSGRPVSGALVRGGGVETKSDARGRFELRGLERGWEGDLVATADGERTGKNRLRALEGGTLEVVLFVR
jgi:protocatechuate 3,4-dioxygenase beta subunit